MITRDVIDALQDVVNGLTLAVGSKTITLQAPHIDRYPTQLTTAQLPLALTWPGGSSFDYEGIAGGKRRFMQSLTIIVYIQPLGQNDIPSRTEEAIDWLDVVRNALLDNVVLIQETGIKAYQAVLTQGLGNPHRDSGVTPSLSFGGVSYVGFTLDVTVRILRSS